MTDGAELERGDGDRSTDGADFVPRPLGGRRTPPLLAWLVALGGVVALAVIGRLGSGSTGAVGESAGPTATRAASAAESSPIGLDAPRSTARPIAQNPSASSGAGPIRLEVVRTSASVFVHADIHLEHVTWVFVQVQTDFLGH